MQKDKILLCPSSPVTPGATILGVFKGEPGVAPLTYFPKKELLSQEHLDSLEGKTPSQVMRLAAPCMKNKCDNYDKDHSCTLVSYVVTRPTSRTDLPHCTIRSSCVWWQQEERQACYRCPDLMSRKSRSNWQKGLEQPLFAPLPE